MMNENYKVANAKEEKFKSYRTARIVSKVLAYVFLVILSVIWIFPFVWILGSAFITNKDGTPSMIMTTFWPTNGKVWSFDNFKHLFTDGWINPNGGTFDFHFLKWMWNTLWVACVSCVISTTFTLMVAYVMSKLKFGFRKTYLNIAMIIGLFPGFMSMIAIYFLLKTIGLTNNLWGLVLCYSAGAGTGFYVAKGFFDVIPNALIESAHLDGATNAQIFWHIILPMSKPIVIYQALMAFMAPWMDFIFAKVILGAGNKGIWTVSVGLYSIMFGSQTDSSVFTVFAAGCVCVAIPIVTLFMFLQKYYVEGVTAGSVK